MSKPTASAAGAALPASVSLAQFSRDLILRNALKLSAADAGDSFAVSTAITPELIAAYKRWLEVELCLLQEELPPRPWRYAPKPQSELVGWPQAKIAELRAREQSVIDGEDRIARMLRAMRPGAVVREGSSKPQSPVERFFLGASPASTRAALVLSTVGCEWRA
jgi:hypothetical protein